MAVSVGLEGHDDPCSQKEKQQLILRQGRDPVNAVSVLLSSQTLSWMMADGT